MKPYKPNSRIEVVGAERLDAIRESGKPAVLIGGHFANWEVMSSAICNRPLDAQITYRSANNPYIDRRIAKARHAYGINVLTPKGAGTRELMRALGRGQPVALMNDQKFNQGIAVPFFGYDAMTAPGPTRLAMKYKAPLVPMSCHCIGPGRYRVDSARALLPGYGPGRRHGDLQHRAAHQPMGGSHHPRDAGTMVLDAQSLAEGSVGEGRRALAASP